MYLNMEYNWVQFTYQFLNDKLIYHCLSWLFAIWQINWLSKYLKDKHFWWAMNLLNKKIYIPLKCCIFPKLKIWQRLKYAKSVDFLKKAMFFSGFMAMQIYLDSIIKCLFLCVFQLKSMMHNLFPWKAMRVLNTSFTIRITTHFYIFRYSKKNVGMDF